LSISKFISHSKGSWLGDPQTKIQTNFWIVWLKGKRCSPLKNGLAFYKNLATDRLCGKNVGMIQRRDTLNKTGFFGSLFCKTGSSKNVPYYILIILMSSFKIPIWWCSVNEKDTLMWHLKNLFVIQVSLLICIRLIRIWQDKHQCKTEKNMPNYLKIPFLFTFTYSCCSRKQIKK